MKNIHLKNIRLRFLAFFVAIFNLILLSETTIAQPSNKAVKNKLKVSSLKTRDNQSLDLHLTLSRGIANTDLTEVFESSDKLELSSDRLTIPLENPALIAKTFSGQASWYGPGFHGRLTASGEVYNQNALTAAHKTLRFGTRVRVTNLNNGRSIVLRINDRGPYAGGRIIDVSAAAARSLGMMSSGVAPVRVTILGR